MSSRQTVDPPSLDVELLGRGRDLIARQLRRAPRQFALGGAGTVLFAVMTIVSSYVIGWITDDILLPAIDAGEVGTVTLVGGAAAVIGVALLRGLGITFIVTGLIAMAFMTFAGIQL